MNEQTYGVRLDDLKKLYGANPVAKSIFDNFATRQGDQRATTVGNLVNSLRLAGVIIARPQVVDFMKKLEKGGCGRYLVGRRGRETRFEWTARMTLVGKAATGLPVDIKQDLSGRTANGGTETLAHTFILRPDFTATFSLPTTLTEKEGNRLADFIRTLSFGE